MTEPLTNIVCDAINGYKAGLAGEPMSIVSEAFDCGWISGDAERSSGQAALASREAETRILQLKAAGTLANNLCPDHRDKQVSRPCLACEIERKDKEIARLRENAQRKGNLLNSCKLAMQESMRHYEVSSQNWTHMIAAIDQENPKC